jgi:hydrogenase expression/formation protein HypC
VCLGIPMTVLEAGDYSALCERKGDVRRISLALVGPQSPGSRVLVHVDNAVRVLDHAEADAIDRAIDGLEAAMTGQSFDHLFADLIDREPELPEHLRG